MKSIALIMPNRSYAPEIPALKTYIEKNSDIVVDVLTFENFIENQFNYKLVYMKMGFIGFWDRKIKIPQIHDYTSLSTGRFTKVKNMVKSLLSKKPILRSFLNEEVYKRLVFIDDVPYIYRDMGADNFFFIENDKKLNKKYDYCYVGSITDSRKVNNILDRFLVSKSNICLVGKVELSNYGKYNNCENIHFLGLKTRMETAEIVKSSKIGFNFMPDIYPWNIQTSTKVIEYLSSDLFVISNKYEWVNSFSERYKFFNIFFYEDLNTFNPDMFLNNIENIDKKFVNCNHLKWDNVFEQSEILCYIEQFLMK